MAKECSKTRRPDYQKVDGFTMPTSFDPQEFRNAQRFKPRKGDVCLASFPKSGTNWTQQILIMFWNNGKPAKDYDEYMTVCPTLAFDSTEQIEQMPSPRLYRTHLPFNLTPYSPDAKYVWVIRNPKDCLLSFYHQTTSCIYDFVGGDFDVFFDIFMNGENDYEDYFDHLLSWNEHRDDPNVLLIYYENMKTDIKGVIRKIAEFLGPQYEELIQDENILNDMVHYSSFEYMKKTVNGDIAAMRELSPEVDLESEPISEPLKYFFRYLRSKLTTLDDIPQLVRKGITGGWKKNFSDEQNERMNQKIDLKLKGTEMLDVWKKHHCL